MTQLPAWLDYGTAYATIFSGIFIGLAGLVFTILQWKFANGQPKRDLEAHRRAIRMAKQERLIGDFAIILRQSVAQKGYMDLQTVSTPGISQEEQEKQRLSFLESESEGMGLALARVRLEGVDEEIIKIGTEQSNATREYVILQKLLFERIDKQDGSDLTFLIDKVKEAYTLATQKSIELEAVLRNKLYELENPKDIIVKSRWSTLKAKIFHNHQNP